MRRAAKGPPQAVKPFVNLDMSYSHHPREEEAWQQQSIRMRRMNVNEVPLPVPQLPAKVEVGDRGLQSRLGAGDQARVVALNVQPEPERFAHIRTSTGNPDARRLRSPVQFIGDPQGNDPGTT